MTMVDCSPMSEAVLPETKKLIVRPTGKSTKAIHYIHVRRDIVA